MGNIKSKDYLFNSLKDDLLAEEISKPSLELKIELRDKVISQIKSQGFAIDENGGIKKPNLESKEYLRSFHTSACKSRYLANKTFIEKKEKKLLDFFANGDEVNVDSLQVKLQVVEQDTIGSDLFRYASLYWSVPVSNGFGRRVRFLLWDTSNHKLIGIFALGDPVFNLKCIESLIYGIITKNRHLKRENLLMRPVRFTLKHYQN
jgi:hypothetical protein